MLVQQHEKRCCLVSATRTEPIIIMYYDVGWSCLIMKSILRSHCTVCRDNLASEPKATKFNEFSAYFATTTVTLECDSFWLNVGHSGRAKQSHHMYLSWIWKRRFETIDIWLYAVSHCCLNERNYNTQRSGCPSNRKNRCLPASAYNTNLNGYYWWLGFCVNSQYRAFESKWSISFDSKIEKIKLNSTRFTADGIHRSAQTRNTGII